AKTISGGTLTVDGAVTGGPIVVTGAGVLRGTGETADVLDDSGTVEPGVSPASPVAGTLHVEGNYTQGHGGTFAVSLSGLRNGGDFGSLRVDGTANLDGTLAITTVAPFAPTHGRFRILDAGHVSGSFATVTGADFGTGTYEPSYFPDAIVLDVNG